MGDEQEEKVQLKAKHSAPPKKLPTVAAEKEKTDKKSEPKKKS
jgi:hypothetical protein